MNLIDKNMVETMRIIIKNPVSNPPEYPTEGTYYFGKGLKSSLESQGCSVSQEFWPAWSADDSNSVTIVLRGSRKFKPSKKGFEILWIISHPALVELDELESYDLVLTASKFHMSFLRKVTRTPVRLGRLCTDNRLFFFPETDVKDNAQERKDIIYVADRQNTWRDMAQWLMQSHIPAKIYGCNWQTLGIGHLVEKEFISIKELPHIYRNSWLGLNDHSLDKRSLGYINNRVLDCLACGLPVLTDDFPEIRGVFGEALLYASNTQEFIKNLDLCRQQYPEILNRARSRWEELKSEFSFDTRAGEVIELIKHPPAQEGNRLISCGLSLETDTEKAIRSNLQHEEQKVAFLEFLISKREKELHDITQKAQQYLNLITLITDYTQKLERYLVYVQGCFSWKVTRPLRLLEKHFHSKGNRPRYFKHPRLELPPQMDKLLKDTVQSENDEITKKNNCFYKKPITSLYEMVILKPVITTLRVILPLSLRLVIGNFLSRLGFKNFVDRVSSHSTSKINSKNEGTNPFLEDMSMNGKELERDKRYWHLQSMHLLEELEYLQNRASEKNLVEPDSEDK